jgi:hypothetical protein
VRLHSFRLVSGADKRLREDTTGAFGIGFTAVYQVTDRPEIMSGIRHWTVDETAPEDERIAQDLLESPREGTQIILPWARDPNSEFRRKVAAAAVADDIEDELITALDDTIGPAMLFLRNLQRIELSLSGEVVRVVTREVDGETVIIDDGGEVRHWHLLRGSFEEKAAHLRARHGDLIEPARKPKVVVAIPAGFEADGRLCATLPTARPTELPVHINAELYLTSDRQQLAMGTQHHSDWNAAAINCAARLLAGALAELPALLGPEQLWGTLEAARGLTLVEQPDAVTVALAAFWKQLKPRIPDLKLVWTSGGSWVTVGEARIVRAPEDEGSFPVLEQLGIALVHPVLRAYLNILLTSQVQDLRVENIAAALRDVGLKESTPIAELPYPLDDNVGRAQLWSQLGRMVGRMRYEFLRDMAKTALSTAAVIPSTDGNLCSIDALWRTDPRSLKLLSAVAPGFPFLDGEQLPKNAEPLFSLCDELTASDAVTQLNDTPLQVDVAAGREIIGWFAQREDELHDADRDKLAALALFPSADAVHPLTDVTLPGDFQDPLELALLVERETGKEYASFLNRLGVRRLSFAVYACDQIPRAFADTELTVEQRRAVVSLLAQRRGQLGDVKAAQPALASVPLVECADGTWQLPSNVYFGSKLITEVLGPKPPRAVLPTHHALAVEELLAWLGVSDEPRAADVISRVGEITDGEVDASNRKDIERIVAWLGQRWKNLETKEQEEFDPLRNLRWLPARGTKAWHEPADLDLVFQDYLYESQGRFLDLGRRIQGGAVELLRWLRLKEIPRVEQVVEHLRDCAKNHIQPNREVYGFLNNNSEAPAIQELRDVECLHIDGHWRRPDEAFWSETPFGCWRLRLGHEFARYRALFDKLGVKETPDHSDAMKVIEKISEKYGPPRNQRVPDDDLKVLRNCWELCEGALLRDEFQREEVAAFGSQRVIADPRGVLVRASTLFFEDLPRLAEELPGIRDHVIRRPDGAWRAMQAAGVRDLSKVAVAHVVDVGDPLDETLLRDRLSGREEELARVIASRTTVPWREVAGPMRELRLRVFTSMVVAWELDAFNVRFPGDPRQADAQWQAQQETLYVAVVQDTPVWEAVARELVRAMLPEVDPATMALDVAAALRPETREVARRSLDAAGFAPLAPEIRVEISTATATDLDAEDTEQTELSGPEAEENTVGYEPEYQDDEDDDDLSRQGHGSGAEGYPEYEDVRDEERSGAGARADSDSGIYKHGENGEHKQSSDVGLGDAAVREESEGTRASNGRGMSTSQPRSRLRSYVIRGDSQEGGARDSGGSEQHNAVDESGVEAVVCFETEAGRIPEVKPHNNPGYDVLSRHQDGEIARYIEVKSSAGPWDELGVGLSPLQFAHARRVKDQYWLYVVEYALDDERRYIWTILDPARRVTEFMFDDGWKNAATQGDVEDGDL